MISMIDLTFRANYEYSSADQLVIAQQTSLSYLNYMNTDISVSVIKHANFNSCNNFFETPFRFLKGKNQFFYFPYRCCSLIKSISPDIILVQGLGFPWQLILVRLWIGKKTKILVQHHGEIPFSGVKRLFQKWADTYVSAYLFTSLGNVKRWMEAGIISKEKKCYEVLEASTFFERKDKDTSLQKCNMQGNFNFIWVGRLNQNKDPLTVVNTFVSYLAINPQAKLYLIYQSEELLNEIKLILHHTEELLGRSVFLIGKVDHDELPFWYSAADYYLSASYREGSGYALLEAMSCGCIPIVTNIPSFRKITNNGKYGYLYEAGNKEQLLHIMMELSNSNREATRESIVAYFKKYLSFQSIGSDISNICESLLTK